MGEEALARFLLALQFLTRLPVRTESVFTPERMRETPGYYPAVGVLVGLITGVLAWGFSLIFPPMVAVLLSTLGRQHRKRSGSRAGERCKYCKRWRSQVSNHAEKLVWCE